MPKWALLIYPCWTRQSCHFIQNQVFISNQFKSSNQSIIHTQSFHDDQAAYNNTYSTPLSSTKFSRCRHPHFAHDKAPMPLHRLPLPNETLMPGRCHRHCHYDAPVHKSSPIILLASAANGLYYSNPSLHT